ncbi:MAG: hypothetical protein JW714_04680 [Candidatus Omnitrophica bacterium]|nr:hypothetical protein [Candidatus Omnitrophota bacterium]
MKQKDWVKIGKLEIMHRAKFLKNLSPRYGFRLLCELHRLTYNRKMATDFHELDKDKLKALAYIHSVWAKVKG